MENVESKTFRNQAVPVDNTEFKDCTFYEATLVYTGGALPKFVNCKFSSVTLQFEDAAAKTLKFLGGVYGAGFDPAVQKIMQGIREKKF